MRLLTTSLLALCCYLCGCVAPSTNTQSALIDPSKYDTTLFGRPVKLYTLSNGDMDVQITNYGGRIVSIFTPDREGNKLNVHWSEPSIEDMLKGAYQYSGTLIGRSANRTGNGGVITIDGKEYQLSVNHLNIHSHGGEGGFSFCVWDATEGVNKKGEPSLTLHYHSKDGEEGYPGNLDVEAAYTLTEDNELILTLKATTDAPTFVNLTSHPFFNLHGDMLTPTSSHLLKVNAESYTPSATNGILTGEIVTLEGTPLDFRTPHTIGERVNVDDPQLNRCNGYDVNYMIEKSSDKEIAFAAELYEPATGVVVEVYSDQPALQLYGGPFQGQKTFDKRHSDSRPLRFGVALEAQNCPNAINSPTFPSAVLNVGEQYDKTIIYKFTTK